MKQGKFITSLDLAKVLNVEEEYYTQLISDLGQDIEVLERAGWTIQSTNPLTISNDNGSLAIGDAAVHAIPSIITYFKEIETLSHVIKG